jgi:hypothetical protein
MAAFLPGGNNTFVPSHEASNKLVVDFARSPKSFALADYTQIVKVKNRVGYYQKMNIDEAGRVMNDEGNEYNWADGEVAPGGRAGTREHEYKPFLCVRKAFPFTLGQQAVGQATWDIVAAHARTHAQKAMTVRTMKAVKVATTTGNHLSTHVIDISALSGNTGTWAASTTARMNIKRSINTMIQRILDDTLAAVDVDDFRLVINSTLAQQISECQEIVDYIKGSPDALDQIKGELRRSNPNAQFGLPDNLYGVKLCVEKTRKVTSKRRATSAKSQVLATATPFMVARPGGLEGVAGTPSFSAITAFMYEEMTTETKRDADNRLTSGRVVEDYDMVLTAPEAAGMFQNAV